MEADKILSVQLIDIVFDGRNKEYGAYILRKNYSTRLTKALLFTFVIVVLAFVMATLLKKTKIKVPVYDYHDEVILKNPPPLEKKKPLYKPQQKSQAAKQPPVKAVILTRPVIVDKEILSKPLTPIEDLRKAVIDVQGKEGIPSNGNVVMTGTPGKANENVQEKNDNPDDAPPYKFVEVPAKFPGNWVNFLLKNLNASVPVDNDAPAGTYSVVIQFVVDKEGFVSEVKALTAHGYGLEEEALRVIRKAGKWEPAIQNGFKVKAYHKQIITFEVVE